MACDRLAAGIDHAYFRPQLFDRSAGFVTITSECRELAKSNRVSCDGDVEKTLGGLRPLEPLHLAFSSPWRHRAGAAVVLTLRWDQRFESAFLQQPVCLSGEPRGWKRKAQHFGGGLRVAGDVRRDVQAVNRDSFALSL
jgi:hypothetical protein